MLTNEKLPTKWQIVKCQNVIDVRDGTHDTPKYVTEGIPLVTSKNLKLGDIDFENISYISWDDHELIKKRSKVDKGDILFSMIGTIGNPVIVNTDKEFSIKNVALFKFAKSDVSPKYFCYLLQSQYITEQLNSASRGGIQKFVSLDVLRNLKIPLPPLPQQQRIAAILDKADSIRRKRQEAIRLVDELLRSVFLDMFGDPVTNPKGWEMKPLSNVAQIQGGLQLTPKRDPYPLELPYLRVANVYRDKLVLDEIKYIKVTQEEAKRVALQKGDILVVEGHGNREEIGRTSVWDASITHCLHQNHLIRIRLDNNKVDPVFISAYLNSSGGRQQLFKFGKTTSGLNTISISNVKETSVLLPPIELQKQYESLVYKNKETIRKNTEQLEEINKMFNSLVQRAFKGEL